MENNGAQQRGHPTYPSLTLNLLTILRQSLKKKKATSKYI